MTWTAAKIRSTFLTYFESKKHKVVPSAPMVVKDDPTLMFTNAGMNQFKEIFLNNKKAKHSRVADSQKCLRVSGKHNDLEEVGVDTYHHTMFEMLGNWSFADYFKEEAIAWAWDLLVNVYGIDKDRIYVTIFEGDKADGLTEDGEAKRFWEKWISSDRILPFDRADNFWEMGDTGPCGPCSEIHVDIRSEEERRKTDGRSLVNQDHSQVIEVWNLVFIQYNRLASGKLELLPQTHIDTGMGLERLAMVLQGRQSNYDTDVFIPLIKRLEKYCGLNYEQSDSNKDVAFRVIADHIRAIAFSIADGQLPSNTGAGYVIRRVLRRAVRYGYSFLHLDEPFLFKLIEQLTQEMGSHYRELEEQQELIEQVVHEEELNFLKTLQRGIRLFEEYSSSNDRIEGDFAFELYDTYGFPLDLTQLLANEKKKSLDVDGFNKALEKQKSRSRKDADQKSGDWVWVKEDEVEEFVGYDYLSSDIRITRYRTVERKGKKLIHLVFNLTPFYPEGGGQVGDTGKIFNNEEQIAILDTRKENNLIIHVAKELPNNVTAAFRAEVNKEKRWNTARNHTATHLLHKALRDVLGTHVEQRGSLVKDDYLRFDFSHFQKITDDELTRVEQAVNEQIRLNIGLEEKRAIPLSKAKEMNALMLFGEKYGDVVRVIQFGDSKELCGGTHVKATGSLGFFKIVSESASAAGIRRIEAITGKYAETWINREVKFLDEIKALTRATGSPLKAVEDLVKKNNELSKALEQAQLKQVHQLKKDLKSSIEDVQGVKVLYSKVELDPESAKKLLFQFKSELDSYVILLASTGAKPVLSLMVSDDLTDRFHAGNMVRELAKYIKGGGGGQPFFATAGGKFAEGIDDALARFKEMVEENS